VGGDRGSTARDASISYQVYQIESTLSKAHFRCMQTADRIAQDKLFSLALVPTRTTIVLAECLPPESQRIPPISLREPIFSSNLQHLVTLALLYSWLFKLPPSFQRKSYHASIIYHAFTVSHPTILSLLTITANSITVPPSLCLYEEACNHGPGEPYLAAPKAAPFTQVRISRSLPPAAETR
jgi:hypothetical protein